MTEQRTIWVVEQGEYSDYGVRGVFSSEANARLIADKINARNGYADATVSEWPLDPAVAELAAGRKPYVVRMEFDGSVMDTREDDAFVYASEISVWKRSTAPAYKGHGLHDVLVGTIWATDVKHAIKIANERRLMMIASGEMQ